MNRTKLAVASLKIDNNPRNLSTQFTKLEAAEKALAELQQYVGKIPAGQHEDKEALQGFVNRLTEQQGAAKSTLLQCIAAPICHLATEAKTASDALGVMQKVKECIKKEEPAQWHEKLQPHSTSDEAKKVLEGVKAYNGALKVTNLSVAGYGAREGPAALFAADEARMTFDEDSLKEKWKTAQANIKAARETLALLNPLKCMWSLMTPEDRSASVQDAASKLPQRGTMVVPKELLDLANSTI